LIKTVAIGDAAAITPNVIMIYVMRDRRDQED
jgi:hypothetical protein